MKTNERLVFPRRLLLVELQHCSFPDCKSRTSLGLTIEDAKAYRGFECAECN